MWLITILTAPVFGTILYLIIGNKKTTKPLDKKLKKAQNTMNFNFVDERNYETELKQENLRLYQTFKAINKYTKFPIYKAENIKYYKLGDEMFPDILEELKKAQKYIFLEYFIIEPGIFLNSIIDILEQKVKDGVDVRLIYDDFGSLPTFSQKNVYQLKARGIKCISFNPLFFIKGTLNNRDHRKMMIIDGHTAFSGGINISDEYININSKLGVWKDNGIRIKGEAVWNFTVMFLEMWNSFKKEDNDYNKYKYNFTEKYKENGFVVPYGESPLDDVITGEDIYLNIINQAKKYVYIYTPYLIIDTDMINSLILAARRGVDVRIVVPGIPDKKIVYDLTSSYFYTLIKGGVKIYTYTNGFVHSKVFLSDDEIATVGTINLDYRSLYLHFECGIYMKDTNVIKDIKKDFEDSFKESHKVDEKEAKNGLFKGLWQAILRLFAPMM